MEKWNSVARGPDGRTTPKEERDRIHRAAPQPSVFRYQHKIRQALTRMTWGMRTTKHWRIEFSRQVGENVPQLEMIRRLYTFKVETRISMYLCIVVSRS